jgi:UDP-glucose 4-epimerase
LILLGCSLTCGSMARVLVTGGCGCIGSHTLVELIAAGHEPISIDDNSRSSESILDGVERATGKRVRNYGVDLRSASLTKAVFSENRDAIAVIHFAAYKTVPESVARPLLYYDNNINALLNVLQSADECGIPGFIFSSSCAVYGNSRELPVTEDTPFGEPECPHAEYKPAGLRIIAVDVTDEGWMRKRKTREEAISAEREVPVAG